MKKILIVINTGIYSTGGLTSVMMNYYRSMNLDGLQIDFCSFNEIDENVAREIANFGGRYYKLPNRKRHLLTYMATLKRLIKNRQYSIIHINGNSSSMCLELIPARIAGVSKRIAHTHAAQSSHPVLNKLFRPLLNYLATDKIAVSKIAGEWLYYNDFIVLNNAIDIASFSFNYLERTKIRKELGLSEEDVLIGNVGKLNYLKNHRYLIDIFKQYNIENPNSKLLIVGGGELEDNLKDYALSKSLENSVVFLGMRNNVAKYLSAMDIFIFTSIKEGLGMALIEAQANGLPCLCSSNVPIETAVTNNIYYMNIDERPRAWADMINDKLVSVDQRCETEHIQEMISGNGFNITREADKLREIYVR